MAVLTHVSTDAARALAAAYDLGELREIRPIPAGSVNSNFALDLGGGSFFLRVYEEQGRQGAVTEAALLTHLAKSGVRTPAPIAGRDGDAIREVAGKPAAIFPWIAGVMRCQRGVAGEDARRVGVALAEVHKAGASFPQPEGRFRFEDLLERLDRIEASGDPVFAPESTHLRAKLALWNGRRDASLPRGLVHGDLFRDNVLWNEEGDVAALLDFESASAGVLAYDLMVTALAWCVGDGLDIGLVRAMVGGYESVRPLTRAEKDGLFAEACVAALRFTVTRITDYAMRVTDGPRVVKDWRRFRMRLEALEALGDRFSP